MVRNDCKSYWPWSWNCDAEESLTLFGWHTWYMIQLFVLTLFTFTKATLLSYPMLLAYIQRRSCYCRKILLLKQKAGDEAGNGSIASLFMHWVPKKFSFIVTEWILFNLFDPCSQIETIKVSTLWLPLQ